MRKATLFLLPAILGAAQPAVKDVTLTAADGYVLKGTFVMPAQKGPRPVVILAHQFRADRSAWKPLADDLNARGIATFALDLRGHGQSTSRDGKTVAVTGDFAASSQLVGFAEIPADLHLAALWVRKQHGVDGRRLALAGSSIGAYTALAAAPSIRPVAVLALSPAGGWGDKPAERLVAAAHKARAAVYVWASEEDPDAFANATALKPVFGVYARVVPGREHGFDYLPGNRDTMAGWLAEVLRRPARVAAKPATEVPQPAAEKP
ncbi:alpha/beta hydrolase [Mesoterricola sediminis]|uniref:Serine aminopeptidase S33 domain-containing protein n=1 Tax=Mesoterricola sediminis TaxID=2927980 RepID=A0AA48KBC3_9BACT|nr:alpha/beta fold hydrolase [Mesoterricola sediminis]BDU75964.1 hypothetical protein METESE_09220 [Mesoterricola sediminis]